MSLRSLTTAAMVAVSSAWLDKDKLRSLFSGTKSLETQLPGLEKAHAKLLAAQPKTDGAHATALGALHDDELAADTLHDRKLRGVYYVLTGLAALSDVPSQVTALLALRDKLFPKGLAGEQLAYRDEGGEGALASSRLDATDNANLAAIPTPWGTLADQVAAWMTAAKTLLTLEDRRDGLVASGATSVTAGDAQKARNKWIQVAHTIEAVAESDDALDDATRERLLAGLHAAEAKATRKHGTAANPPAGSSGTPAAGTGGATS